VCEWRQIRLRRRSDCVTRAEFGAPGSAKMQGVSSIEPIVESDDEIKTALEQAELPPLLAALAYVTGDLSLLRDDLRPNPMLLALPQGGLSEEQQATARALARAALTRFRDGGSRPAPPPSADALARI